MALPDRIMMWLPRCMLAHAALNPLLGCLQGATTAGTMITMRNAASPTPYPPPNPRPRPRPKVHLAMPPAYSRVAAGCVWRYPSSLLHSVAGVNNAGMNVMSPNTPGSRLLAASGACKQLPGPPQRPCHHCTPRLTCTGAASTRVCDAALDSCACCLQTAGGAGATTTATMHADVRPATRLHDSCTPVLCAGWSAPCCLHAVLPSFPGALSCLVRGQAVDCLPSWPWCQPAVPCRASFTRASLCAACGYKCGRCEDDCKTCTRAHSASPCPALRSARLCFVRHGAGLSQGVLRFLLTFYMHA